MFVVPSIRKSGGLAMLWKAEVNLDIQTYDQNHIDALILTDPNSPWNEFGSNQKNTVVRNHGVCCDIYILDFLICGCVSATSM